MALTTELTKRFFTNFDDLPPDTELKIFRYPQTGEKTPALHLQFTADNVKNGWSKNETLKTEISKILEEFSIDQQYCNPLPAGVTANNHASKLSLLYNVPPAQSDEFLNKLGVRAQDLKEMMFEFRPCANQSRIPGNN